MYSVTIVALTFCISMPQRNLSMKLVFSSFFSIISCLATFAWIIKYVLVGLWCETISAANSRHILISFTDFPINIDTLLNHLLCLFLKFFDPHQHIVVVINIVIWYFCKLLNISSHSSYFFIIFFNSSLELFYLFIKGGLSSFTFFYVFHQAIYFSS